MAAVAARRSLTAARSILLLLFGLTLFALILHVSLGSTSFVSPLDVVSELLRGPKDDTRENAVVWFIRLPRGIGCLLIGSILGAVGSAFQGLFRNPLAEPYIVGVSSGAAVGGVAAEIIGWESAFGGIAKGLLAFAGGFASLLLVIALAGRRGATSATALLLSGVVIGSMLSAVLSLLVLSSGRDSNRLMQWLLGDASSIQWPGVYLLAAVLALGIGPLISQTKAMNAFAIGEETATRLGVSTRRLKAIVLISGTAMAAVAVGVAGVIAFVGLVAPHLSRAILGVDWRRSLIGSIFTGAMLLLVADAIAQRLSVSWVAGLPVGAVTALIGAPSLLILLRRVD